MVAADVDGPVGVARDELELARRLGHLLQDEVGVELDQVVALDGLAGGASKRLVQVMGLREAAGTVLDHLHVISPEAARRRLGLEA